MTQRTEQEENEVGSPSYLQRLTGTPKDFFREFSPMEREAIISKLGYQPEWETKVNGVDDFHVLTQHDWTKYRGCGQRFIGRLLKRGWVTIITKKARKRITDAEKIDRRRKELTEQIERMEIRLKAKKNQLHELDA